ncbi:tyrosine-type recombinase/integrase [Streptococcus lutetiensis]|uniref:tyrosine-type recombinase/integrase n=1 Tax=Streptococcus lutetiensis TaxID=150055 RepID=UPI001BDA9148|nr:site-specific integrase [Streptococcus lutetiensis]MBT0905833.1 tyrosine-type recombinase/integrase [Streptococcus lutetiensis]
MWSENHKSGKINFVERYRDPYTGKWKKASVLMEKDTPRIRKQAQKILDEKIAAILQELNSSEVLYTDVLNNWWKFHQKELRRTSISSLKSNVQYVRENFGIDVKISKIDTYYVQQFINGLELSRPRLERVKSILNQSFDYAVSLNHIKTNPARQAKLPKKVLTIEDYEKIKNKYLEIETELIPLINELRRTKRTYLNSLIVEFLFLDGARIGEVVALEDINYRKDDNFVDIFGTLDSVQGYKKAKKEPPKTPAGYRSNKLSKRESEILDEAIKIRDLNKNLNPNWITMDRSYIFVTNRGVPIQRNSFNESIKAANQRLEHPINKPISSHIFRHTLVSYLAEKGVPLKAIMDRVGHEDSETTMKIYTHVTNRMKDKVVDVIDELSL